MNRIITKVNQVKYFTQKIVNACFFNFNRSTIYAFLVFTRPTDGTFQGSPNFSKRFQRLSYSSSEPNLFLVLAEHIKSCGLEQPSNVTCLFLVKNREVLRRAIARKSLLNIKKLFFFHEVAIRMNYLKQSNQRNVTNQLCS